MAVKCNFGIDLNQNNFEHLLKELEIWCKQHGNINILKVLFFKDIANKIEVKPIKFFKILWKSRIINPVDIIILIEAVILCGMQGIESVFKRIIPKLKSFKQFGITRFTNFQQHLVTFGHILSTQNKTIIEHLFDLSECSDVWVLILKLQQKGILTEKTKKHFIAKLNSNGMHAESDALSTELEDHWYMIKPVIPTIKLIPELSEEDFLQLLVRMGIWWKRYGNVNVLKMVLSDFKHLSLSELDVTDDPFNMFKLLWRAGLISPSNFTLLNACVVVCGLNSEKYPIEDILPSINEFGNIEVFQKYFSEHRLNLFKFGSQLKIDKMQMIAQLYDLSTYEHEDPWVLIRNLEAKRLLTVKTKDKFIQNLRQNGMSSEADALCVFTKKDLEQPQEKQDAARRHLPWKFQLMIAFAFFSLVLALYISQGQIPEFNTVPDQKQDTIVTKLIDVNGGNLELQNTGIRLHIPPGAIDKGVAVNISLEHVLNAILPVFSNLSRFSPVVKCGPAGTAFNKMVYLSFPHHAVEDHQLKFTALVKKPTNAWQIIETDDNDTSLSVQAGRVIIKTNHFCEVAAMANGTKRRVMFGIFGGMLKQRYLLRVRIFHPNENQVEGMRKEKDMIWL